MKNRLRDLIASAEQAALDTKPEFARVMRRPNIQRAVAAATTCEEIDAILDSVAHELSEQYLTPE